VFENALAGCPRVREQLEGARRTMPVQTISGISYINESFAGDGFVLVGDASMFVDPIFSAGVTLAVRGGIYAADTIVDAFQLRDFSAARLASYEARIRPPMDRIFELIRLWYEGLDSTGDMIRRSRDLPWLRERLVVLLSGGYDKMDLESFARALRESVVALAAARLTIVAALVSSLHGRAPDLSGSPLPPDRVAFLAESSEVSVERIDGERVRAGRVGDAPGAHAITVETLAAANVALPEYRESRRIVVNARCESNSAPMPDAAMCRCARAAARHGVGIRRGRFADLARGRERDPRPGEGAALRAIGARDPTSGDPATAIAVDRAVATSAQRRARLTACRPVSRLRSRSCSPRRVRSGRDRFRSASRTRTRSVIADSRTRSVRGAARSRRRTLHVRRAAGGARSSFCSPHGLARTPRRVHRRRARRGLLDPVLERALFRARAAAAGVADRIDGSVLAILGSEIVYVWLPSAAARR
jgi:hypothetical protein